MLNRQLHQACMGGRRERRGGFPNAKRGAVNRRKRKWVLGGPRTSNVHQRQTLCPVCAEANPSWGSGIKGSGGYPRSRAEVGATRDWGEGWGQAPARPGRCRLPFCAMFPVWCPTAPPERREPKGIWQLKISSLQGSSRKRSSKASRGPQCR